VEIIPETAFPLSKTSLTPSDAETAVRIISGKTRT